MGEHTKSKLSFFYRGKLSFSQTVENRKISKSAIKYRLNRSAGMVNCSSVVYIRLYHLVHTVDYTVFGGVRQRGWFGGDAERVVFSYSSDDNVGRRSRKKCVHAI